MKNSQIVVRNLQVRGDELCKNYIIYTKWTKNSAKKKEKRKKYMQNNDIHSSYWQMAFDGILYR